MNYLDRLIKFNKSDKYKTEIEFLQQILDVKAGDKILDYGCGLCEVYKKLRGFDVIYYDVVNYVESSFVVDYLESDWKFTKVYFMHSVAHVNNLLDEVEKLKDNLADRAEIVIITPNRLWLELKGQIGYIPDPTVVNHFSAKELETFFVHLNFKTYFIGTFGEELEGQHERIFAKFIYSK